MKINIFRTQLTIGAEVKYKGVKYKVQDFDRTRNEINLARNKWVRFSEVELLVKTTENGKKKKVKKKVATRTGNKATRTVSGNTDK